MSDLLRTATVLWALATAFAPIPAAADPVPMPVPAPGSALSLRSKLVDFVDCAKPGSHGFTDDGKSRLLDLPSGRFRVTAAVRGFDLSWFAYRVKTAGRAGAPHWLVCELSNDRERYTTVSLTVPRGAPWSSPYRGEEARKVNAFAISQEPLWYEPDVGLSVYTGRGLPADNKPFCVSLLFFPKADTMKVTVSSSGWANPVTEWSGGAVRRIWVFEILDSLADHLPPLRLPAKGLRRHAGIYATHPWYFLAHYGVPPHTRDQRRTSLENLCDTLAFCGLDLIEFNAINGSDRAGAAWYPGSYYPQLGADLLSELPPVARERGIDLVPVVTSITPPGRFFTDKPDKYGFSTLSFQAPADRSKDPRAFGQKALDPLRPEVQNWLIRHLVEIGERCRDHANVIGVGFRVNGKIGTCYVAGEDKTTRETIVVSASEVGYSSWDLEEFAADTGRRGKGGSPPGYKALRADPRLWDLWLDFRCRRTRAFWLRARDAIRKIRGDWILYVLTDLPAEVPSTNVEWPGPEAPGASRISRDLLRAHGYDPRLFRTDDGIIIQRVLMADADRFFSKWGPPWGSHPLRYRDFHEQEDLARSYATPAGSAAEIYHNYWEEAHHPDGEFGPDAKGFGLRTATAAAFGREFFRPWTFSLRATNADSIVLTGWNRPVLGHEIDLRPMAAALRALPRVRPRPLRVDPPRPRITAGLYGDRVGVINDTANPAAVMVELDRPLPAGRELVDAVTSEVLLPAAGKARDAVRVVLKAYDVRVFRSE